MATTQEITIGEWRKQAIMFGWSAEARCRTCRRNRTIHCDELIRLPVRLTDPLFLLESRLCCRSCGGRGATVSLYDPEPIGQGETRAPL